MKIFIDLGAFDGDTIKLAMKKYKRLDKLYAFEPLKKNFDKLKNNLDRVSNIVLINAAADTFTGEAKLYCTKDDYGGSLCEDKEGCFKDKFELVRTIDFSRFLIDNFTFKDSIILKMDIEGKEYDIIRKMIEDNSIKFIREIYCEWHSHMLEMSLEAHRDYISQLRRMGYNLTGDNKYDEFACVHNIRRLELQIRRYCYYYIEWLKRKIKNALR